MPSSIGRPTEGGEVEQASLLAAVAEPVRLRILSLTRDPLPVMEICRRLDMAQPRVSHHLAILREAGLLEVQAVGRRRFYCWAHGTSRTPVGQLQGLLAQWLSLPAVSPSAPTPAETRATPSEGLEDFLL